jgi:hypothetical protein
LYLETLPLWTRGCVSIPNHTPLTRELRLLERRTARSGKDSVDHGPSGSDDFANALAGAMWLASRPGQQPAWTAPIFIPKAGGHFGDHPGWGLADGGGTQPPGIATGPEYSGNGGAGANRGRGGW